MRVVFIGSSQFGLRCLQRVSGMSGIDLVGVVTAPEKFSISYNRDGVVNVLHADVQEFCRELSIPCAVISDGMKDESLFRAVQGWKPDMFLVCGWYHMIPKAWRNFAPAYGLHASLLPDYCGGAPLVWAMINGEERTGITFFKFDDGVDSGPIVAQSETYIDEQDTIKTLYDRIENIGLDLIGTYLPRMASGDITLTDQDESHRRVFPQRKPSDGLIDWNRSAKDVYNFIRAQTKPYPGAFTFLDGKKITIWSAELVEKTTSVSCGDIIRSGDCVFAGCEDEKFCLRILSISVGDGDIVSGDGIRRVWR